MRIAIASENGFVAQHFGRCPEYVIFDVTGTELSDKQVVSSPGHQPGLLPAFLAEFGVARIITGGMGPRAQELFQRRGIEAIIGAEGPVDLVARAFLKGELRVGESACEHPGEEHAEECHHEGR